MVPLNSLLRILPLVLLVSLLITPASARDGQRNLLHDKVNAVQVTFPGSYVLVDNVIPYGELDPLGPADAYLIHVRASNVTIDLNGHRIGGNHRTDTPTVAIFCDPAVRGVRITNGTIDGVDYGIIGGDQLHVENVTFNLVGFEGIIGKDNAVVRNCIFDKAGFKGEGSLGFEDEARAAIRVGAASLVRDCTITSTGGASIDSSASFPSAGIIAGSASVVSDCSVQGVSAIGLPCVGILLQGETGRVSDCVVDAVSVSNGGTSSTAQGIRAGKDALIENSVVRRVNSAFGGGGSGDAAGVAFTTDLPGVFYDGTVRNLRINDISADEGSAHGVIGGGIAVVDCEIGGVNSNHSTAAGIYGGFPSKAIRLTIDGVTAGGPLHGIRLTGGAQVRECGVSNVNSLATESVDAKAIMIEVLNNSVVEGNSARSGSSNGRNEFVGIYAGAGSVVTANTIGDLGSFSNSDADYYIGVKAPLGGTISGNTIILAGMVGSENAYCGILASGSFRVQENVVNLFTDRAEGMRRMVGIRAGTRGEAGSSPSGVISENFVRVGGGAGAAIPNEADSLDMESWEEFASAICVLGAFYNVSVLSNDIQSMSVGVWVDGRSIQIFENRFTFTPVCMLFTEASDAVIHGNNIGQIDPASSPVFDAGTFLLDFGNHMWPVLELPGDRSNFVRQ